MSVLVVVVALIVSSYHCVKMDEHQCIGSIVDRCTSCFAACSDSDCRPFGPVQALFKKPGTALLGLSEHNLPYKFTNKKLSSKKVPQRVPHDFDEI